MRKDRSARGSFHASGSWGDGIPDQEWAVYDEAIVRLQAERIPIALGGAFALATYSGYWRNTKDLDFYILEEDLPKVVEVFGAAGLDDYFGVLEYDRGWIYRAHRDGTIVDAIFGMPNRRARCTPEWLVNGPEITVRGRTLRVLPPEELIFAKIFVMQRPRCDWPDIINVIYGAGPVIDWEHLLGLLDADVPLLRSVLSTFSWLAPGRAGELEAELWGRMQLPAPEEGPLYDVERIMLLETRPWFAPLIMAETND
ncbi:MAG TPA: hypothetical protein VNA88_05760 [Candidatus Kapabacteria bacterium]|jgi:hypothetical protein|nr:hypothetical protein [Candidatus Kapabacteria bacterium]